MKKLIVVLGLALTGAFAVPHLLPGEALTCAPSASEARAWEHRLRAYHRARARIQLNERLDGDAQRQAIDQLRIDYFDAAERERLRRYERERDRQRQALDL